MGNSSHMSSTVDFMRGVPMSAANSNASGIEVTAGTEDEPTRPAQWAGWNEKPTCLRWTKKAHGATPVDLFMSPHGESLGSKTTWRLQRRSWPESSIVTGQGS